MQVNIHIFIFISTIIFYFLLKSLKNSVIYNYENKNEKNKSNFIYVLYMPIISYILFYFYCKIDSLVESNNSESIIDKSSSVLSSMYPIKTTMSDLS
jgi:hypothetical protein